MQAFASFLPAITAGADYLFNDPSKPYNDAAAQFQKYYQQAVSQMQPWQTAGNNALGQYQNALSPMGNTPGYINNIMNQWQMSPWAQFQMQQGMKAMNNANSASGMMGSGAQMKAAADYSQGLASRDMQQWLQNNLGVNQQYMGGLSDISHQGLAASQSMGQLLGQLADAMGLTTYGAGQANHDAISDIFGALGGGMSSMMGKR